MNKELLQQALAALEESLDLVVKEHQAIDELYGIYPSRKAEIDALDRSVQLHKQAIIDLISAIAQPTKGDAKDAAHEAAAKALYETWHNLPGYVPWQDGGTSFIQDEARKLTRAAIAQPASVRQPLTDAEITSLAYDCNALPEVVTDKTLIDFVRAIEAAHAIAQPEQPVEPTSEMAKAAADAWLDCGSKLILNKAMAALRAGITRGRAIAQPVQPTADTQDASRYRWLRDHENGNCVVNGELLSGEKLDRAVDSQTGVVK